MTGCAVKCGLAARHWNIWGSRRIFEGKVPALRKAPQPSSRHPHLRLVTPPSTSGLARAPNWVEVRISWGNTPLDVTHLCEPTGFVIADTLERGEHGFIAAPKPGEPTRSPIVVKFDEGMAAVIGDARDPRDSRITRAVLSDRGHVLHGARRDAVLVRRGDLTLFPLTRDRHCRFTAHGLLVELEVVTPEIAPKERKRVPPMLWAFAALVLALHVVVLAMILRIPPASAAHAENAAKGP